MERIKATGGDEDGKMEAMLRRKFSRLLERFGLDHLIDDGNQVKDNKAGHGDKRLDELWESVQTEGVFAFINVNYIDQNGIEPGCGLV